MNAKKVEAIVSLTIPAPPALRRPDLEAKLRRLIASAAAVSGEDPSHAQFNRELEQTRADWRAWIQAQTTPEPPAAA